MTWTAHFRAELVLAPVTWCARTPVDLGDCVQAQLVERAHQEADSQCRSRGNGSDVSSSRLAAYHRSAAAVHNLVQGCSAALTVAAPPARR